MIPPSSRALPLVRVFTHLLVTALLLVTVFSALTDNGWWRVAGAVLLFVLVYAGLGWWMDSRPELIPVWGALLTAAWLLLVMATPMGVWLAFPLFLLALDVLPTRFALPVVAGITAAAVVGFIWHSDGWGIGAVLGPVIGALVSVAIITGLRATTDESIRRGRLQERERFSREVHDTLAQGLGSIHLLLGAAEGHLDSSPDRARALLMQARRVASENLDEARRLVRAQGPADLAERSLPEALARLVADVSGPRATFQVDGVATALPGAHDVAILRIAQESVANAVRHAGAGRLAVTLTYGPDEVLLDVVDDGSGDVREGAGFGLGSMRARAEELGGTLSVEPSSGHGTAIGLRLPVGAP